MSRISMVTRTIETTKVLALCVNVATQTTCENEYILSGTFKDNSAVLKALVKVANTDDTKVVHIISTETVETLYGMSEQDFIASAKILPPRKA